MTPRVLTPEEEAVLDAVFAQRARSRDDIFEYDPMEAQSYLAQKGSFVEYALDVNRQLLILGKLADDHIIDIDYLIRTQFANAYRSIYAPKAPLLPPEQPLSWGRCTAWAYEVIQKNGRISIEQIDRKTESAIFIKMSMAEVVEITKNYKACHKVRLKLDVDYLCLSIKFDDEQWIQLPPLHEKKPPFKIIKYAYQHPGRVITAKELKQKGGIDTKDKYFQSQIFSDNGTIQALHPLLLRLGKRDIMFVRGPIRLTLVALNELKSALKLI